MINQKTLTGINRIKLLLAATLINMSVGIAQTEERTEIKKEDKLQEKTEERERIIQLTLISPIGTNGIDCYKTTNKVSLNIFAGVARGVNGVEVGSYLNVILKDVKGLQAAGFANVVLNDVKGAQFAGFVNYSGGNLNGAAGAGFANVNLKNAKGGQFAGFANANMGTFKGAQFAGFANYNQDTLTGVQGAGYANVTIGNVKGAQLAGFANIATGDVQGVQASGFVNYARKVKGAQFGFINIADSVDGASIGFCNIVKKGLHQVEVSGDELFYTNVAVRTGTHRFYNIFSAGGSSRPKGFLWSIGYGAGTSFAINEKLRTDLSLSVHHVSSGLLYHATSELYKLYWGAEYKIAKKCFIAAGPTFNLYWGDALQPDYAKTYSSIVPYSMLNETNTYGFNFKAWVGGKVAIRFL